MKMAVVASAVVDAALVAAFAVLSVVVVCAVAVAPLVVRVLEPAVARCLMAPQAGVVVALFVLADLFVFARRHIFLPDKYRRP